MTFDEILKTIRKELNITQEQLARDLNVSFSTLNRWENNRNTPSKLARMRLVDYCTKKSISSDIISELERVQDTIKGTGVTNYDDNNR